MGVFSHIVAAVDGSEPAQRAAAFAIALAAREGARISFCTAVDPTPAYVAAAEGAIDCSTTVSLLRDEARELSLEAMMGATAQGVHATSVVLEGTAAAAIQNFADQHNADAIVVGTHGRRGLARAVLGSVACGLVRNARIPVFTVRANATIDAPGPIVVAADLSSPSLAALRVATALARDERTALHLVHVFDDHDLARVHDHPGYDPAIARRRAMTATADDLNEIADRVRTMQLEFTSEMCEGDPVAQTIAAAARVNARYIATGTHTHNAIGRFFAGSVAEGLMRFAPVPVMVVRA